MPLERKLILSKAFEKAYKKFTGKNPPLKISIGKALHKLQSRKPLFPFIVQYISTALHQV
jgi:hypothetical protein